MDSSLSFLKTWLDQGESAADTAIALPTLAIKAQSEVAASGAEEPEAAEPVRFLRFYFNVQETALLPLTHIQEVLKIPTHTIVSVPEMPAAVCGVCYSRGTMLWLVDLGKLLGFTVEFSSHYAQPTTLLTMISIQVEEQSLGLIVPAVLDIEQHPPQQLQPTDAQLFPEHLIPFLDGYLSRSCSPVLSARAIVEYLQYQQPLAA